MLKNSVHIPDIGSPLDKEKKITEKITKYENTLRLPILQTGVSSNKILTMDVRLANDSRTEQKGSQFVSKGIIHQCSEIHMN